MRAGYRQTMKVIESKKVEKVNGKNRASISQYTAPKRLRLSQISPSQGSAMAAEQGPEQGLEQGPGSNFLDTR